MALRGLRQEFEVNVDFVLPWTQERGGILSLNSVSGIQIAEYATQASGAIPLGIQLNDIENIAFDREYHPQRIRSTDVPFGTVGIGMEGEFETDWIHIVGTLLQGQKAYVGPSGTITNSNIFGGQRIGRFLSALKSDPHTVVFRGLGFSREKVDPVSKEIVIENDPASMILVVTPGFAKIDISQSAILRG